MGGQTLLRYSARGNSASMGKGVSVRLSIWRCGRRGFSESELELELELETRESFNSIRRSCEISGMKMDKPMILGHLRAISGMTRRVKEGEMGVVRDRLFWEYHLREIRSGK